MAKMRSPNYPAIGLPEAIRSIKQIWDREKRTAVPNDVLGRAMGYTSVSGPVRTKIAALRKYGLLDQMGGNFKLSDLAMRILHSTPDSQELKDAINTAALRPEAFRELYQSHADASDDALKSHLLVRKNFSEAGAKQFIKAFRETLSIANPLETAYIPSEDEESAEDEAVETELASASETASHRKQNPSVRTLEVSRPNVKTFTWPLSRGVTAEVRFSGGDVQANHLDLLAKYLELAKSAIETDDDDGS